MGSLLFQGIPSVFDLKTVKVRTHHIEEAHKLAEHVLLIENGRVAASGNLEEITRNDAAYCSQ